MYDTNKVIKRGIGREKKMISCIASHLLYDEVLDTYLFFFFSDTCSWNVTLSPFKLYEELALVNTVQNMSHLMVH